jgi:hypothetical protein
VDNVFLFELHDWLSDFSYVFIKHLSFKDREKFRIVVHDSFPVGLSDRVSFALSMGSMDEDLSLVKADIEGSNYCILSKSEFEFFSFVDLVSNIILSLFNKKDFIHFIQFNVNDFSRSKNSRLKRFQDINHKVLVLNIIPGVETVVNSDRIIFVRTLLREIKKFLEVLDESFEQEITIDFSLDVCRQLL